jgi:hypothetical protein
VRREQSVLLKGVLLLGGVVRVISLYYRGFLFIESTAKAKMCSIDAFFRQCYLVHRFLYQQCCLGSEAFVCFQRAHVDNYPFAITFSGLICQCFICGYACRERWSQCASPLDSEV